MRRPLKPFVTEYKGSRRGPSPMTDTSSFEFERPAPRIGDAKLNAEPDADDSYEAAMRAADALFASPASSKKGSEKPGEEPPQAAAVEAAAPPERGGRILRVIDEPPAPQYAALEAEHAPRRRGRKPGSKNKPKIAVAAPAAHAVTPASFAATLPPPQVTAPPHAALPVQRVAALPAGTTPARAEKRFPWVRDRLKPGEDWKRRRLPRVCW